MADLVWVMDNVGGMAAGPDTGGSTSSHRTRHSTGANASIIRGPGRAILVGIAPACSYPWDALHSSHGPESTSATANSTSLSGHSGLPQPATPYVIILSRIALLLASCQPLSTSQPFPSHISAGLPPSFSNKSSHPQQNQQLQENAAVHMSTPNKHGGFEFPQSRTYPVSHGRQLVSSLPSSRQCNGIPCYLEGVVSSGLESRGPRLLRTRANGGPRFPAGPGMPEPWTPSGAHRAIPPPRWGPFFIRAIVLR